MGTRIQGMLALLSGNSATGGKNYMTGVNDLARVHTGRVDVDTEASADG